jgi:hypothetical protein
MSRVPKLTIYLLGMYESPTTDWLMNMKMVAYAHFAAVGTWVSKRSPCEVCGWHWQEYGPPLQIQWERSTDVVGDFSWDGPFGYLYLVKEAIADSLSTMKFKCRFLPVKVVPPAKRSRARLVPSPSQTPKLLWAVCETFVELDRQASEVVEGEQCSACGRVESTFRRDGIVIRRRDWHGEQIFRIATNGNSEATFVTEEGRRLIQGAGFSNIAFTPAGEIVD